LTNQKQEKQSNHIYYTLLLQVHSFAALFTILGKLSKYVGEKPFSLATPAYVDFFLHPILMGRVTY
jgi:hypothetical protein